MIVGDTPVIVGDVKVLLVSDCVEVKSQRSPAPLIDEPTGITIADPLAVNVASPRLIVLPLRNKSFQR